MSAADIAVQVFRRIEPEDIQVLRAVEVGMSRHEYVPENVVLRLSGLHEREFEYRINRLREFRLIRRWVGPYVGYVLNMAGYDCLAINAFVRRGVIEAFGKPLGVGKEADVYDALTPSGERVAVKFQRLGRTSFRQTRRVRGYAGNRRHISWLYRSRLAAEREFEALQLLYPAGVSVPRPISQNRHAIVMGIIEGAELFRCVGLPDPGEVLDEILLNVRKAYVEVGVIHADLSEYNVILQPDGHVLIIDWPQYVRVSHPNADQLLERDLRNILRFFQRKFDVTRDLGVVLAYVRGGRASPH